MLWSDTKRRHTSRCMNINGAIETVHEKVANALGSQIVHVRSTTDYDAEFIPIKMRSEAKRLNINEIENHVYNDPI